MKKAFILLFTVLITLATTTCGKLDLRDEYVGDYTLKIHGEMAFSNGTSQTIDVDDAELHITKASEYLKLNVTGYYQCEATVAGNVILLGSMHTTFTNNQGVLFDMDIHESNGVLLDNTLTFVNQITGTATSQGVTYEFDSWFSNEALKK